MKLDRHSALFAKLAGVWTVLILVGCWLPGNALPEPETAGLGFEIPNLDKLIHLAMFLGFGGLWMLASRGDPRRAALVGGLGLLLAVVTEAGQALPIVQRDAGIADALADSIGLAIGIGTVLWLAARSEKRFASMPVAAENRT